MVKIGQKNEKRKTENAGLLTKREKRRKQTEGKENLNRNCGKRGETSWEIKRKRGRLKRGTSKRGNEMSKGRSASQEGEMRGRRDGRRKKGDEGRRKEKGEEGRWEKGDGRKEKRGGGEECEVEGRRGESVPDGK